MAFVPRDLVSIQVGRLYASVYPKVEPTMPIHERAHAFQVIKSTLKSLPVDTRLILEAIGTQLNCNSIKFSKHVRRSVVRFCQSGHPIIP